MNNAPKISVITITFNSERTLEETIKSVISQGYDNLEYLIIDGGSKDKTLDIVNKYRDSIVAILWFGMTSQSGSQISVKPTMRFPLSKKIKAVCHQSTFVTKKTYTTRGV